MVESPCIAVCRLDLSKDYCDGCWRTLNEIARWRDMSDTERLEVLAAIEKRRDAVFDDIPSK